MRLRCFPGHLTLFRMRECKLLFLRKKWLWWKNSQKHHVCIAAYFRFASINLKKFYVENQGFLKFYPMVKSACPYLNPSGNDSVPKMTLFSKAEWMKKLIKIISDSGFFKLFHHQFLNTMTEKSSAIKNPSDANILLSKIGGPGAKIRGSGNKIGASASRNKIGGSWVLEPRLAIMESGLGL